MSCTWQEFEEPDITGRRRVKCTRCGKTSGKTKDPLERIHSSSCRALGDKPAAVAQVPVLSAQERKELFGESDPTLLGNRIAELTKAIGIPPCGGCNMRIDWLNRAHVWLREKLSTPGP